MHRERRRERAEEVLHAERVDAVLHADAGVVLREHGRRHADETDAAMRGRRGVADHVEHRAAADRDDEGVPIDVERDKPALQSREQRVVLDVLAAGDATAPSELQASA